MTEDTIRCVDIKPWKEGSIPSEAEVIHAEMEREGRLKLRLWYRLPTE